MTSYNEFHHLESWIDEDMFRATRESMRVWRKTSIIGWIGNRVTMDKNYSSCIVYWNDGGEVVKVFEGLLKQSFGNKLSGGFHLWNHQFQPL